MKNIRKNKNGRFQLKNPKTNKWVFADTANGKKVLFSKDFKIDGSSIPSAKGGEGKMKVRNPKTKRMVLVRRNQDVAKQVWYDNQLFEKSPVTGKKIKVGGSAWKKVQELEKVKQEQLQKAKKLGVPTEGRKKFQKMNLKEQVNLLKKELQVVRVGKVGEVGGGDRKIYIADRNLMVTYLDQYLTVFVPKNGLITAPGRRKEVTSRKSVMYSTRGRTDYDEFDSEPFEVAEYRPVSKGRLPKINQRRFAGEGTCVFEAVMAGLKHHIEQCESIHSKRKMITIRNKVQKQMDEWEDPRGLDEGAIERLAVASSCSIEIKRPFGLPALLFTARGKNCRRRITIWNTSFEHVVWNYEADVYECDQETIDQKWQQLRQDGETFMYRIDKSRHIKQVVFGGQRWTTDKANEQLEDDVTWLKQMRRHGQVSNSDLALLCHQALLYPMRWWKGDVFNMDQFKVNVEFDRRVVDSCDSVYGKKKALKDAYWKGYVAEKPELTIDTSYYMTDIKKFYSRFAESKWYRGGVKKLEQVVDDYMEGKNGVYVCDIAWCDSTVVLPSNVIEYARENNVKHTIHWGVVGEPCDLPEFTEQQVKNKTYCRLLGMMNQSNSVTVDRWHRGKFDDMEHDLPVDKATGDIIMVSDIEKTVTINNQLMMILGALSCMLMDVYKKHEVYGANIDCIFTKYPVCETDEDPFWKRSEKVSDDDVKKMPEYIGWVSNPWQMRPTPQLSRPKDLPDSMVTVIDGFAGSGKTTLACNEYRWWGTYYTTFLRKLVQDKRKYVGAARSIKELQGWCEGDLSQNKPGDILNCNVIIVDEYSMVPDAALNAVIHYAMEKGISVVMCGDRAQLWTKWAGINVKQRLEWMNDLPTQTLLRDWRSKDEKLLELKKKLWYMVLDDKVTGSAFRSFIWNKFSGRTSTEEGMECVVATNNITAKSFEKGCAIDSVQGRTIDKPYAICVGRHDGGRKEDYKNCLYVAISRATKYNDIHLMVKHCP